MKKIVAILGVFVLLSFMSYKFLFKKDDQKYLDQGIEYGFTEYNYDYRIRRMVDKKTGIIVNASALMKEEVKNNYQFITQFDLKQIDY